MREVRVVTLLVLAAVAGACRSSSRVSVSETKGGPDPLAPFVGQKLILRHFGDHPTAVVKPGETRKGTCDVAVQVASVSAVPDGVRFTLTSLGRVRVGEEPTIGHCERLASPIALSLKGVHASQPEEWRSFLGTMLLTPEAYLAVHGKTATHEPLPEPTKYANRSTISNDTESRTLANHVTSWPKPILAIEPAIPSPGGKVHHEGELEFGAVIGADGRVFKPVVKTPLSDEHQRHVESVLTLWRFEPAREGDRAVPALYEGRTVLRIY
jgi:hypothetical protein